MQTGHICCDEKFPNVKYIDPVETIIKLADENRLVMINESHHKPVHRLFIAKIATKLSNKGYRQYGSEMLGNIDKTEWLNSEAGLSGQLFIPDVNGFKRYWNEPVYAQVLETLAQSKFAFFAYEGDLTNPPDGVSDIQAYREKLASKNIKNRLQDFPNEKFLVHAGYHHVKEKDEVTGIKWLAERLKETGSIDPITISQTECYLGNYTQGNLLGYSLVVNEDGTPLSKDGYDLIIAAPDSDQYFERPVWLRDEMDRKFITVPNSAKFDGSTDYTTISAYRHNRPYPAAPEDMIYRAPFSEKVLALRVGDYNLVVRDRDKTIIKTVPLTVR